jgi:iron complex outermembrane recepter protein
MYPARDRGARRALPAGWRRATSIRYAFGTAGTVASLALPALAQDFSAGPEAVESRIKVIVTGSNIPTVERETALPVQIITREEIERANLQTAAQLVNTISAAMSFGAFNEAQALGGQNGDIGQAGFAGAGLRGLGYQATLVLLNGRRIANWAFTTLGGDLNAIPLAAVERVEVLKSGASAIYGSDALAGVINFILRKDFQGAAASAQYTSPEHTGGYAKHFNVAAGYGNLASQAFNAYAMVDYQEFGGIQARDRPFAARNYIPAEGVDRTSINSLPANVDTLAGVRNPTGDPARGYALPSCAPPLSFPTAGSLNQFQCRWNGDGSSSIVNPSERLNVVGAFTWQLDQDSQLFLTGTYARNRFEFAILPTQVSSQTTFEQKTSFLLPATSPYYPHDFARTFRIDGTPLNVYWSAIELGPRTIAPITDQWNVVAGIRGVALGWTYDGAFNYSRSDVDQRSTNGYVRESALMPILNSGVVNPFGPNTQAVVDLMSTAKFNGTLRSGTGSTASLDFVASADVLALPSGPLSVAIGLSGRREEVTQTSVPALESGDILNLDTSPSFSGTRDIGALFAEANIPLASTLEANIAVRYDHYSDFGGTTNPQVSLRWQPAPTLLLRGSTGTGFFAPSLTGLFTPPVYGLTPGSLSDPARCPVTQSPQDCNTQFAVLGGGNPALQPTTSKQWGVGGVFAPTRELSLGLDYVSILLDDRINFLPSAQIFAQCPNGVTGQTCYLIHRGPVDPAYPTLPGPIVQVDQFLTNLGKQKVSAIDFNVQFVAPQQDWGRFKLNFTGTYTIENRRQQLDGSYPNQVNHYSIVGGNPGVIPYWRHYLELDWNYGPWSVTVTETFQTGGYDQSPAPGTGTQLRTIGDYDLWNLGVIYAGFRNWTLSGGIKNLFDRNPPFSNQTQNYQVGYDPSYADPHGRLYWVGVEYAFR